MSTFELTNAWAWGLYAVASAWWAYSALVRSRDLRMARIVTWFVMAAAFCLTVGAFDSSPRHDLIVWDAWSLLCGVFLWSFLVGRDWGSR